jgi:hypothetical protein
VKGRLRADVVAGAVLPGALPRAAVVALACTAFALVPLPAAVIAVAFAVVAAVVPASLGAWAAALAIGLGQLAHPADPSDWRSYAALAVVHLLHVIGGMAMVVDPWGRMQVRALRRPLLRWLWIQLPAQAVLAAVLLVPHAPFAGAGGAFAIAAAVCLCAAAVVIVRLASPRR